MTEGSEVVAGLSTVYRRLSGVLLSDETLQSALRLVTTLATETVPGSTGAAVTLTDEGRLVTTAATDETVRQADELQYEVDAGPCLEAMRQQRVVRVDDLAHETRWPAWTSRARSLGIASVLSVPLHLSGAISGAIKVYAPEPSRFGTREQHLLTMFGEQASVLLANVRSRDDLERAGAQLREVVRTRDTVSMAKGVLMADRSLNERAAFAALVEEAGQNTVSVRELAERILAPYADRDS